MPGLYCRARSAVGGVEFAGLARESEAHRATQDAAMAEPGDEAARDPLAGQQAGQDQVGRRRLRVGTPWRTTRPPSRSTAWKNGSDGSVDADPAVRIRAATLAAASSAAVTASALSST